jgi:hypothetical protein
MLQYNISMLSFNNWKECLFILLITVVMGYFLGITVSTVVDYRLKDAIINLPKPKNKIMVNLNDSDIMETFKSSSKKSKKSAKKAKKNKKKSKKNCLTKSKSKSKKKDDLKEDTDYFIESFSSKITDPNLNQYKTKFEESEKTKKVSEFRAANEEEDDQNYQKISN